MPKDTLPILSEADMQDCRDFTALALNRIQRYIHPDAREYVRLELAEQFERLARSIKKRRDH